jgi:hypothetical protein
MKALCSSRQSEYLFGNENWLMTLAVVFEALCNTDHVTSAESR